MYTTPIEGTVAVVTASKENNGIIGYIKENDEIKNRKLKGVLTIAPIGAYTGICFYQEDYFTSTGNSKIIEITNSKLKDIMDANKYSYHFLARILTKNFCKTLYGYSRVLVNNDVYKTPILLPCLEVSKEEDYIWEENGKYYTLATSYISYIYLQSRVNFNQKLIDEYTYEY
ncbi:hypothetical protein ACJA23_01740 [Mycoplasma corogypsi]|uniref:hypothetical protein n=1 Tax=Mycoplasma corogypsi TaxID=2106 RepID=UPI00387331D7